MRLKISPMLYIFPSVAILTFLTAFPILWFCVYGATPPQAIILAIWIGIVQQLFFHMGKAMR